MMGGRNYSRGENCLGFWGRLLIMIQSWTVPCNRNRRRYRPGTTGGGCGFSALARSLVAKSKSEKIHLRRLQVRKLNLTIPAVLSVAVLLGVRPLSAQVQGAWTPA